jgi:tRNA ligase
MQKILILPVAIIGSGKTTLAKVLSDICPLSFCHVQSDNMPRKFTAKHFQKHVLAAFEKHEVVFADKNNHLRMHRERLTQAFVERYPDGLIGMTLANCSGPRLAG